MSTHKISKCKKCPYLRVVNTYTAGPEQKCHREFVCYLLIGKSDVIRVADLDSCPRSSNSYNRPWRRRDDDYKWRFFNNKRELYRQNPGEDDYDNFRKFLESGYTDWFLESDDDED